MKKVWFAVAFGAALLRRHRPSRSMRWAGAAAICARHARSISIPCVRALRSARDACPHA
jgi:hypothetical protein